jgi:hypothetical protein
MENFRGDDGTRSSRSRFSDNQMTDQELEAKLNKDLEPLDKAIRNARKLLPRYQDHPDAILLNKAYENLPVQINLNDPSLPGTKT